MLQQNRGRQVFNRIEWKDTLSLAICAGEQIHGDWMQCNLISGPLFGSFVFRSPMTPSLCVPPPHDLPLSSLSADGWPLSGYFLFRASRSSGRFVSKAMTVNFFKERLYSNTREGESESMEWNVNWISLVKVIVARKRIVSLSPSSSRGPMHDHYSLSSFMSLGARSLFHRPDCCPLLGSRTVFA